MGPPSSDKPPTGYGMLPSCAALEILGSGRNYESNRRLTCRRRQGSHTPFLIGTSATQPCEFGIPTSVIEFKKLDTHNKSSYSRWQRLKKHQLHPWDLLLATMILQYNMATSQNEPVPHPQQGNLYLAVSCPSISPS